MSNIGFTGTREGMTTQQKRAFLEVYLHLAALTIHSNNPRYFHHGDCIGSDEDAHHLLHTLLSRPIIVIHPPSDDRYRAHCLGDDYRDPLPFLERNKKIVDASDVLIATPLAPEAVRSGTWSTVRYASKMGIIVYLIDSQGQISLRLPESSSSSKK